MFTGFVLISIFTQFQGEFDGQHGLVGGHEYTLTGAVTVRFINSNFPLIREITLTGLKNYVHPDNMINLHAFGFGSVIFISD